MYSVRVVRVSGTERVISGDSVRVRSVGDRLGLYSVRVMQFERAKKAAPSWLL